MIVHDGTLDPIPVWRGKLPCLRKSTCCNIEQRITIAMFKLRNFCVVNIPAKGNKVIGLCFIDELNKAFLLMRKIRPRLIAVIIDSELGARSKNSTVSGFAQFVFQPSPLLFTQEGCCLVRMGRIVQMIKESIRSVNLVRPFNQVIPEGATVQQNDLYRFLSYSPIDRVVDAFMLIPL